MSMILVYVINLNIYTAIFIILPISRLKYTIFLLILASWLILETYEAKLISENLSGYTGMWYITFSHFAVHLKTV